jgi:hypothetical protein
MGSFENIMPLDSFPVSLLFPSFHPMGYRLSFSTSVGQRQSKEEHGD